MLYASQPQRAVRLSRPLGAVYGDRKLRRRALRSHPLLLPLCIAWLALAPQRATADIYRCGRGDRVHYTNKRGRGCTAVVRGKKRRARPKGTRPPANAARRASATKPSRQASQEIASPHRVSLGRCAERPYQTHLRGAAALYQLPLPFLRAVMRVESRCNARATSPKGAMGLMQLMPKTATAMGVTDPYDPRQNIYGGARYLRILANRFGGDVTLTTAAYNAGSGAVTRYGGVPPYEETQRYVKRVIHHFYSAR